MRNYWVAPLPPFHTADGAAYNTSTTLTDVAPTPAVQLPAGILEVGTRLEFYVVGRYSTTGTPTLNIGIYTGTIGQAIGSGVALCTSGALTTTSGAANKTWRLEGHATVRTAGTSGTVMAMAELSNITTLATDMLPATAPATATVDTTVTRYITVGATWGTSSASNTLTVHYFGVRLVN